MEALVVALQLLSRPELTTSGKRVLLVSNLCCRVGARRVGRYSVVERGCGGGCIRGWVGRWANGRLVVCRCAHMP